MGRKSGSRPEESPTPPEAPLARLLESPTPLAGDDDVTVAAASLRSASQPALPVIHEGRLVGTVSDRELLGALARREAEGLAIACRTVARSVTAVPVTTPPEEALWLLQRDGIDQLAVVDLEGRFLGVLNRRRLVEAMEDAWRPRLVGGLATPFGVHLTSLHHRGGANDVALVATGFWLAGIYAMATVVVAFVAALVAADPMQAALGHISYAMTDIRAVPVPSPEVLVEPARLVLFLGLLRLTPLAGYHSGEHQTVHALERGLALTYEQVSLMPRPHPRCGTNLMVGIWLVALLVAALRQPLPWSLLALPALAGLVCWRRTGAFVQQHFTTKPASRRQIEAGISAARLLLARHQRAPRSRAGFGRRFWNRGLCQVVVGALLFWQVSGWLARAAGWLAMR